MGAYYSFPLEEPVGRAGLAILTAAAISWPAFTVPAAARGPEGIADVAEQVIDAVVNVSTKQSVDLRSGGAMPQLPPGSPFEEFSRSSSRTGAVNRADNGQNGQNGQNNQTPTPRRVNSAWFRLHCRRGRPRRHQQSRHCRRRRGQCHPQ